MLMKPNTRRVLKYEVPMPESNYETKIRMPLYAEPISLGIQGDQMVIWAVIDPDKLTVGTRSFIVLNTGTLYTGLLGRFIGTVTTNGIVWHVFEKYQRKMLKY